MAFKQNTNNFRIPSLYGLRLRVGIIGVLFISLLIFPTQLKGNEEIRRLKNELDKTEATAVERRINLLNDLGWEYTYIDLDTAFFFASQALQLAEENRLNYPAALANSYGTVGILFDLQGNNEKALNYYLESLTLKKSLNDSSGIANLKTNIGALFFTQEDYAKALPYFNEALSIEMALKDTASQIGSLINIAIIQKNQNQLELCKRYLNEALSLNKVLNDPYYGGIISNNLGAYFLQMNELDSALFHFKKGEVQNYEAYNFYNQGIALENQANIYLRKKEFDKAKTKIKSALEVGEKNNYYFLLTNSYETLYEIYLASGEIDSAFVFKAQFMTYKDSILDKENKQIVDEIEAKYNLVNKEKELLERDIVISKSERNEAVFKAIIFAGSIVALLLIWVVLSKVKNNSMLSEKNSVIEKSLEEKEVLMREIHHRVKNNIQAIKSLINIQKRTASLTETKESLNETLNRVNAMSLIHEKLYQQNSLYDISADIYFSELIEDILKSFGMSINDKNISLNLTPIVFKTDTLLTMGLIVNELITNSCKYGKSENGQLDLTVSSSTAGSTFELLIRDKGKTQLNDDKGFGSDLIDAMVFKLKGKISYLREPGYCAKIIIPINDRTS